ncbi:MAG: vWA domain-containing protein, partial [Planctomycetota bacterium]
VKKLMQASLIMPKPKVRKVSTPHFAKSSNGLSPINLNFGTAGPSSQSPGSLAGPSGTQGPFSLADSANFANSIEFFGSSTKLRKVCYLVDCSGSMLGVFGRVQKELKDSIVKLQPDQYFYIIFFGGDRLFEFRNGRLLRATPKAKSTAYNFVDSIRPTGQTNALAAFERAMQIRDGQGLGPAIVYFLTDGFELTTEDKKSFTQKIANLQRRFAPRTKINTIGFWPQSRDRELLRLIAKQSGGEFVFVADGNN